MRQYTHAQCLKILFGLRSEVRLTRSQRRQLLSDCPLYVNMKPPLIHHNKDLQMPAGWSVSVVVCHVPHISPDKGRAFDRVTLNSFLLQIDFRPCLILLYVLTTGGIL